ncbi:hypothetical protein KY284_030866 [Solanum tuberosum]|nr:hypothetical protein KY284_030866 [Solanum tuberosum]
MASLQQPIQEIETSPDVVSSVETVIETTESHNSSIEEVETDFVAKIKKNIFTLWRNVTQDRHGDQIKQVRLYHVWPGKNVRMLLLFVFYYIHLTITHEDLSETTSLPPRGSGKACVHSTSPQLTCGISLRVFANLIMVSVIDPGIIPRNNELPSPESTQNGRVRSKRVFVNGSELKLKYCRICKIYRPIRSCHCIVCDNCVDNFDHHCPWIGQCIGLRNYRLYVLLLVIANVYFVYIFGFSCLKIQQKNGGNGLIGLVRDCPETLVLACFSFVAACFVGGLACYHVYLIATNQTAYENFRQQYGSTKNPFDKGVVTNIKEVLFSPWTPSRINFRSEI